MNYSVSTKNPYTGPNFSQYRNAGYYDYQPIFSSDFRDDRAHERNSMYGAFRDTSFKAKPEPSANKNTSPSR